MSPVLDQGGCNACAAHAASSVIESCLAIASSKQYIVDMQYCNAYYNIVRMFLLADTLPEPISQQHLVECTLDYGTGNGTEMFRTNKGCDTGFTDVHLIWLQSEGQTIKTALDYPLTPKALGECKNDILNNIRKREVFTAYIQVI